MTTKEIVTIDKKVTALVTKQESQANALTIATLDDMKQATELLSEVNRMADKFEAEKELLTKPLNTALKEIRSRYKPIEGALGNAISTIRYKMSEAMKKFDAEAEAKKEKLMARVEKGTMRVETAVAKMEDIPDASATVLTDSGSVQWMIVKKLVFDDMLSINKKHLSVGLCEEFMMKSNTKYSFTVDISPEYIAQVISDLNAGKVVAGVKIVEEKMPKNTR